MVIVISLTSKFEIKRAKSNSETLEYRHWELTIQVKVMLLNPSELHIDSIVVVLVDQLEIFD